MSFEEPKMETVHTKDPVNLKSFLNGKSEQILQKMVKESYTIRGIIRDDQQKDPTSMVLDGLKMFSDREIAEAAQTELESRSSGRFFAV